MSGNRLSHSLVIKYSCTNCPDHNVKSFESVRGLRIHNTRCHPDSPPLIIPNVDGVTPSTSTATEDDFVLLFHLKSKIAILRRIPKGARAIAAKTLVGLIRNCIAFNNLSSWLALFSFSYVDTLNSLRSKHPQSPISTSMSPKPSSSDECLQVDGVRMKKAISSIASGSAAGPDGFRPQFFKDLTSISAGNAGAEFLTAITELSNFMLRGEVNEIVCKYLYGASLCAMCKKCGGIRPIAIGLSVRRLTSKLAVGHAKEVIGDYFLPNQLGFGVHCGCEAAVHATRSFVTLSKESNRVTLKIDYSNAYNTVGRDRILSSVKNKTPLLFKYFWQCYANPTYLMYDLNIIHSASGIQQGDPAGAFLFPLAIHHIIDAMESDLNVWYQDDGTLSDSPDIVLKDFAILIEQSKKIGLTVNPSKCELHFASGQIDNEIVQKFNALAPGIRIISDDNFNLLGAPILHSGFDVQASSILETVAITFDRLKNLSAHSAYFLLRHCLAIPKFNYLIRSSTAWIHEDFIKRFDNMLKTTLENILNISMKDKIWTQATLPTSYGGLGIRRLKDIAPPAFLSSINGTNSLVSLILHSSDENNISHSSEAIDRWNSFNYSVPSSKHIQKEWDKINVLRVIKDKLNFSSALDIARFKALQCPESNAWINVIPSKQIGTFLDNSHIRVIMALRIGAPICRPHICPCGTSVAENGIHGLSCQKSIGRFPRHTEHNRILAQSLSSINFHAALEPPGLHRNDGKRPDGLTLVPFANGRYLVWDVTCWDTLAPSHLSISARQARRTAELASTSKHNKYSELKQNGYIFNAFATETLGPWSADARNLVNKIGPLLNETSGDPRSHQYLVQRISLATQRANVSCIVGTLPTSSMRLDQIFYL